MNKLTIINQNSRQVVDNRQVANLIGKTHAHLLRDISGYAQVIESSNESKFGLVDFFIESSYQDSKGEIRLCYLLTKKGCDMVANKMTGQKGVLFTAAYVTAFETMRERIETGKPLLKSRKTEQELAAADKRVSPFRKNRQ